MDYEDIARQLRRRIDAREPFTGGHQLIKPRSNDRKGVPDWALDNKKVQQVVLGPFPNKDTKQRDRNGAARWIRIIHLYWRMGKTEGQVAEEMGTTVKAINHTIARIRKVANGLFADSPRPLNTRGTYRNSWGGRRPGAGRLYTNP